MSSLATLIKTVAGIIVCIFISVVIIFVSAKFLQRQPMDISLPEKRQVVRESGQVVRESGLALVCGRLENDRPRDILIMTLREHRYSFLGDL